MRKLIAGVALIVIGAVVGMQWSGDAEAQGWPVGPGNDLFVDPDRFVHIESGTPYTVPADRILVVGAVTREGHSLRNDEGLLVDGQFLWKLGYTGGGSIDPGIVARPGQVVSLSSPDSSHELYALGKLYLEGQDPGF